MKTLIPSELLLAKDRLDQAILIYRTPQDADSVERLYRAVVNANSHLQKVLELLNEVKT